MSGSDVGPFVILDPDYPTDCWTSALDGTAKRYAAKGFAVFTAQELAALAKERGAVKS